MGEVVYEVGVEDIESNHWVAYVFDLFGCFSSGRTEAESEMGVLDNISNYSRWLRRGNPPSSDYPHLPEPIRRVHVAEVFHSYPAAEDPEYLVNAFFQDDARPLTFSDIQDGWRMLEYTREDLLVVVRDLSPEVLNQPIPGDIRFGTISGILKHVAVTEWWYCQRLGLVGDPIATWSSLPDDPLKALDVSRANTVLRLPELADDAQVIERSGERWSGRKVLRRTLWHERDHTEHIRKLLAL